MSDVPTHRTAPINDVLIDDAPVDDAATGRCAHPQLMRWLLGALALAGAFVGVWATFFPRSFYDSSPGAGRRWVSIDGPFNEHLVRDVGSLNLALALVAVVAAVTLGTVVVRAAAGAWLVYSVPHLAYHLHHLGDMATVDAVGNVVTLSASVIAPVVILVFAGPARATPAPRPGSASEVPGEG